MVMTHRLQAVTFPGFCLHYFRAYQRVLVPQDSLFLMALTAATQILLQGPGNSESGGAAGA
jgi:hypothetical protein